MDHISTGRTARRELENHLINRALRDDEFRRRLIADPKGALEAEMERLQLGMTLPAELNVVVLEESPDTMYLILPPSLIAAEPAQDDFFLEALKSLNLDKPNDEPS